MIRRRRDTVDLYVDLYDRNLEKLFDGIVKDRSLTDLNALLSNVGVPRNWVPSCEEGSEHCDIVRDRLLTFTTGKFADAQQQITEMRNLRCTSSDETKTVDTAEKKLNENLAAARDKIEKLGAITPEKLVEQLRDTQANVTPSEAIQQILDGCTRRIRRFAVGTTAVLFVSSVFTMGMYSRLIILGRSDSRVSKVLVLLAYSGIVTVLLTLVVTALWTLGHRAQTLSVPYNFLNRVQFLVVLFHFVVSVWALVVVSDDDNLNVFAGGTLVVQLLLLLGALYAATAGPGMQKYAKNLEKNTGKAVLVSERPWYVRWGGALVYAPWKRTVTEPLEMFREFFTVSR